MKVHLPKELPGKRSALQFTKTLIYKSNIMSNNLQLTPGSFKALFVLAVCLVVVIQIFK